MIIYAHRANLHGPSDTKNEFSEANLAECLKLGFYIECDIWVFYNKNRPEVFLQHNEPDKFDSPINHEWLIKNSQSLLIHCKNSGAVTWVNELANKGLCYFHWFANYKDEISLTNMGQIISFREEPVKSSRTVIMMPEGFGIKPEDVPDFVIGVCTDYPIKYRESLNVRKKLFK